MTLNGFTHIHTYTHTHMNQEIQIATKYGTLAEYGIQESQLNILREKICPAAPLEEIVYFCSQAVKRNLNPVTGQLWLVERWDSSKNKMVYSIQTGIAGLRAIADRTSRYTPSEIPSKFEYDNGKLMSCTAFVKKYARGTWHQVSATAYFDEFVALKKDKTPNKFWLEKPRLMLEKCAEALALRKAFPDELAGLYILEEIPPSEQLVDTSKATLGNPFVEPDPWEQVANNETKEEKLTFAQLNQFKKLAATKKMTASPHIENWCNKHMGCSLNDIPQSRFDELMNKLNEVVEISQTT